MRNRASASCCDASPGWRELITLGKVWHLEQMRDARRAALRPDRRGRARHRPRRHASSTCRAWWCRRCGRARCATTPSGSRRCSRTRGARCCCRCRSPRSCPCARRWTLVERVRGSVGAVDRVVVNGVHARAVPGGLDDLRGAPRRAAASRSPRGAAGVRACWRAACGTLHERHAAEPASATRARSRSGHGLPIVPLPYLPDGVTGPDDAGGAGDARWSPRRARGGVSAAHPRAARHATHPGVRRLRRRRQDDDRGGARARGRARRPARAGAHDRPRAASGRRARHRDSRRPRPRAPATRRSARSAIPAGGSRCRP